MAIRLAKFIGPLNANPLVPAGALFLVGAAIGWIFGIDHGVLLGLGIGGWCVWLFAEIASRKMGAGAGRLLAHLAIALCIFCGGALLVSLDRRSVENTHIVRFAPDNGEVLIACRAQVVAPPQGSGKIGNAYWNGSIREIWTDRGWIPSAGQVLVKWAGGENAGNLRRGQTVELYGWLSRPLPALNPGALDPRQMLAADRVFALIRVPRADGLVILSQADAGRPNFLARLPLFLRSKLLAHTQQIDAPAAETLEALLFGRRDPAIADVSRDFARAGIAHLLAISGSHIAFIAAMIWLLLRQIPMRPRLRELLTALILIAYVLATPCGPPIVRVTIGVLLVLAARFMGRPPQPLNIVAAAAIIIILMRPADIASVGFQLTFVSTVALILAMGRIRVAIFGKWLEREDIAAALTGTAIARRRHRTARMLALLVEGNVIGLLANAPLVAFHFGQLNLEGLITGAVILPIVAAAMLVGIVQVLAELISSRLAAAFAGVSAFTGRVLIDFVHMLASLPGAAVALRPPPAWAVILCYVVLLLWIVRKRVGISRAMVINSALAAAVAIAAWFAFSTPLGQTQIAVLSAGDASAVVLRTPSGRTWSINAGSAQGTSVLDSAIRSVMRLAGRQKMDGVILTDFASGHAGAAGDVISAFNPPALWTSAAAWQSAGATFARAQFASAATQTHVAVSTLERGKSLLFDGGLRIDTLWPAPAFQKDGADSQSLILLLNSTGVKILLADPADQTALALIIANPSPFACDAVIFTGPERGDADQSLRRIVAPLGTPTLIWSGRTPWAPRQSRPGEWNTADGAILLDIRNGRLSIHRD